MAGIQLVAERIGVSLDVPGTTQSFNFTQNVAKLQSNNIFVPVANGASNKIISETRNNNLGGFRWVHETTNGQTSGTYKLLKFLNDDQTGAEIFSFDQNGNASFANNLTINGSINASVQLPSTVVVSGATQTFQYNNNYVSTFTLFNNQSPAISNNSLVEFNMKNSANGGFRLAHTYQLTDSAGLGSLDLKIVNSSNTAINVMSFGIDGGGVPTVTSWGNTNLNGNNVFNLGGVGLSSFQGPVTFTNTISIEDPTLPQHAVNLGYLQTYVSNAVNTDSTTLTGAVTGTGTTSIDTALNSSISISGASQLFSYASQAVGDYIIQNLTAPTAGNPKSVRLNILNSTGGGYRFVQTHSNTDTAGLSQLKLQAVNNVGVSADVFTAIINGSGVPEMTFPGNMNYSGNNIFNLTSGLSAFHGPATFYSTVSGQNPTLDEHLATKYYVDNSITSNVASTPITLTGAVTGINSISNPIFTSFANTIPISGSTQTFNFSLNPSVVYNIVNTLSPTIGTPSSVSLFLRNSTTGGYRHYHEITSTTTSGLGTYKFQAFSSAGANVDIYNVSISNLGIGTFAISCNTALAGNNTFGGTNTFNGDVNFNAGVNFPSGYTFFNTVNFSNTVTFNGNAKVSVNQASYAFDINNTAANAITEYTISNIIPYVKLGYNDAQGQAYIDSVFQPFHIRMAGVNVVTYATSGNVGINTGTTGPTQAKLVVIGGVSNISGEDSAIRAIGSSAATKIEIQNTAVSGKLYELRSRSTGSFDITDRTGDLTIFTINSSGNTSIVNTLFARTPSGTIFMQGNATGTVTTTANVFVKVSGTTTSLLLNQFTAANNRLTYGGAQSGVFNITASISSLHNGNSSDEVSFVIFKNGIQLSESRISQASLNTLTNYSINITTTLNTNDYVEVWAAISSSNRTITVTRLMLTASAT